MTSSVYNACEAGEKFGILQVEKPPRFSSKPKTLVRKKNWKPFPNRELVLSLTVRLDETRIEE